MLGYIKKNDVILIFLIFKFKYKHNIFDDDDYNKLLNCNYLRLRTVKRGAVMAAIMCCYGSARKDEKVICE